RDEASWSLPYARVAAARSSSRSARALAKRHLPSAAPPSGPRLQFKHRTYSHDLSFEVWSTDLATRPLAPHAEALWAGPSRLRTLPLRAPTLKALKKMES